MAQDRIDIKFPAKDVSRFMSFPLETSKEAMKKMGTYLIGHKRMVYTYPLQRAEASTSTVIPTGLGVLARGAQPAVAV